MTACPGELLEQFLARLWHVPTSAAPGSFEYSLAASMLLGLSPVGCLHAAFLFWRLRVFTGRKSGCSVPAGLYAQECSQAHLIYLHRYNLMLTVIICP